MKIKTWMKYNVGFRPTPRCRKLRYREEEEYVDIELSEISYNQFLPAFDAEGLTIYFYDNSLWRVATERDIHCGDKNNPMTALDALIYAGVTYSTYFGASNVVPEEREQVVARAKRDMAKYLLVDGELYVRTAEPMYDITTLGLGNNHAGIGTSLGITYHYNPNKSNKCYFNALEYEQAVKTALEWASKRGDTKSFDYIKNVTPIKVYDSKYVKRNPKKDHVE